MPAAFVTRHLTAMLNGPLADAFVSGGQSTRCLFDDEAQVIEDGTGREVQRRTRMATIRTGSVTNLVVGGSVTVAGVSYEVRSLLPMDDGNLTRVLLARAG